MSKRKHERRRAREGALALLYSSDITELDAVNIVEDGAYPADGVRLSEYAESLVAGVCEHRDEIDRKLASTSENWALDRMPIVDRAILRLAVYEMLFVDEVPVSVAINEAVELAKAYGGEDDSSRFVNGVLGKIARSEEAAEQAASAEGEPADGQIATDEAAPSDEPAPEPAQPAELAEESSAEGAEHE